MEYFIQRTLQAITVLCITGYSVANCPSPCTCLNNVIICVCNEPRKYALGSFDHIDYIQDIYIHSCDELHIARGTFSKLSIGRELSIFDIKNLTWESLAFEELQRSPQQITIRDAHIDELPELVFAGLNKAEHFWFRNVSIGVIRRNAFAQIADLQYVYFRESSIGKVETGGFGHMRGIDSFFIRGGRTKINEMDAYVFAQSEIASVVITDAAIGSMHASGLAGFRRATSIELSNTTISYVTGQHSSKKEPSSKQAALADNTEALKIPRDSGSMQNTLDLQTQPQKSEISNVLISDSFIPVLNIGAYLDAAELRISNSTIGQLIIGGDSSEYAAAAVITTALKPLKTVDYNTMLIRNVIISNCKIAAIDQSWQVPRTGSGIRTDSVMLNNDNDPAVVANIDLIHIYNSQIQKVKRHSFAGTSAKMLIIEGCYLSNFEPHAFWNAKISVVKIQHNRIGKIIGRAFEGLRAQNLLFTFNSMKNMDADAFSGAVIQNSVHFSNNTILDMSGSIEALLQSIPSQLQFIGNHLPCKCTGEYVQLMHFEQEHSRVAESETSGQFLSLAGTRCFLEPRNPDNSVILPHYLYKCALIEESTSTGQQEVIIHDWLNCTRKFHHLTCYCIKKIAANLTIYKDTFSHLVLQRPSVSVLTISHCRNLILSSHSLANSMFTSITISDSVFHIEPNALKGIASLQRLVILNSQMDSLVPNSLSLTFPLQLLHMRETLISKTIYSAAFQKSKIQILHFDQSKIGLIEANAFAAVSIYHLRIHECEIESVEAGGFDNIENLQRLDIVKTDIQDLRSSGPVVASQQLPELRDAEAIPSYPVTCFYTNLIGCDCSLDVALRLQKASQSSCTIIHSKNTSKSSEQVLVSNVCSTPPELQNQPIESAKFKPSANVGCANKYAARVLNVSSKNRSSHGHFTTFFLLLCVLLWR